MFAGWLGVEIMFRSIDETNAELRHMRIMRR